jgi:MFS family permease
MNWFKKSMFSNQRFLLLFCGQGISYFGNSIAAVAIPILVLTDTQSAFLMGLVGALEVVPVFVIGLAAGVWVDRWSRKTVMLVSDFGRALVMGLIPAASLARAPMMPVVVVVVIVSGTLAVFFGAAYTGLIRRVVGEGELGRANGYFEAMESIAYGLGPLFVGILTSKIGASYTIGIDALSFLFSAISILGLRSVDKRSTPSSKTTEGFFLEMKMGVQTVLKDSVLSAVTLLWGSNRFVFAALIPTLTFFVLKTLHGDSFQVGVAVSLYAVGSLIGTLIGSRLPTRSDMMVALGAQPYLGLGKGYFWSFT